MIAPKTPSRSQRIGRTILRPAGWVLGSVLVLSTGWAGAQGDRETTPDPELSAALTRTAVMDLGLHESPTTRDYELTANLLSIASDLEPHDVELARTLVQASWLAGEQQMMLDATRRVISNDPKDTVAQLRLISSIINQKQTVEERIESYERFLGSGGSSLDRSVRSRLALDAALLERERGNADKFIQRLHQATQLDMSHKAAASLAAQYHSGHTDDPVTVLDYQFKLLNADPLDPHVHLTITRLLAAQGAHAEARRFLNNAVRLFRLDSGGLTPMVEEIRIAIDWQVDGPEEITRALNATLNDRRTAARAQHEAYIEAQLPTDDLPTPRDIRYDMNIDKLRLLAWHSMGREEETRRALIDFSISVSEDLDQLNAVMAQQGVNINAVLTEVVNKIADLQSLRALVGINTELIRADVETIIENQPAMEPYFRSIEPMALYAEGNYEQALEASEPYSSVPAMRLIRAACYEELSDKARAIEIYKKLAQSHALSAYGAYSFSRLKELGVADEAVTVAGRQMMQIARTVPTWIDQMIKRPGSFMKLDLRPLEATYPALARPRMRIRLRNTAPIPMSVGPDHPIDSRFLIVPLVDENSGLRGEPASKVIQLDQRLRLRPLEEITVEVLADSAQTDWLLSMQPNTTIRQRWRLLQGFRPRVSDAQLTGNDVDPDASIYGIISSPLGLTDESHTVQRLMLSESRSTVDQLIEQIGGDPEPRRRAIMASAGRLLLPAEGAQLDQGEQRRLVGALMEAYTRAGASERAWMLLVLPQRHQVPTMIDFDDHAASSLLSDALIDSSVNPVLLAAALLTRTDDAQAPVFETLRQVNDDRVQRIAEIIRSRLSEGRRTIGTVGPGVGNMFPNQRNLDF